MNKQNIAVYGLGIETEKRLSELQKKYNIVGLLDSFQTDGEMYGIPILSFDDAVKKSVSRIVVAARPSSCRIIASNIGEKCKANNIELYDVRGIDLLTEKSVAFNLSNVVGYTYNDLITRIDNANVVSFDLFDTLIMRTVPTYRDYLEVLALASNDNKRLISSIDLDDRYNAEVALSKKMTPSLYRIYESLYPACNSDQIEEYVNFEYEHDLSGIVLRNDMIDVFNYAKNHEKKIYITTDTYYRKHQIKGILDKFEIAGYDDILVSCEYNTRKTEHLFDELKKIAGNENILHIGDDITADFESAKANGIDAFNIFSAYEVYMQLGELGLTKYVNSITDKCKVGIMLSVLFNSPFQFERTDRAICITDIKYIGKMFFAPIMFDYMLWLGEKTSEDSIGQILFSARDGYLLKDIFEKIYEDNNTKYLITSRISALRAGVDDESDIISIDKTTFSGTLEEKLKLRFGINAEDIDSDEISDQLNGILKYKTSILKYAKIKREHYRKYLDTLNLTNGKKAFVDLAAKGTVHRYMQRIVGHSMEGYYLFQLEPEYAKEVKLSVTPFFSKDEVSGCTLYDDFYLLEPIMSSTKPTVVDFNDKAEPVYETEYRSGQEIDTMLGIQKGMLDYTDSLLRLVPKNMITINKELDNALFGLIHNIVIDNDEFYSMQNIDSFVNRKTTMKTGI